MLPDLDSNQDLQSQNLTYYHYTIGQITEDKKARNIVSRFSWPTWIRTKTNRTKICRTTIIL